jgi:hypothetical protein
MTRSVRRRAIGERVTLGGADRTYFTLHRPDQVFAARAVTGPAMSQQRQSTRQLSKSIRLENRTISGHRWRHVYIPGGLTTTRSACRRAIERTRKGMRC